MRNSPQAMGVAGRLCSISEISPDGGREGGRGGRERGRGGEREGGEGKGERGKDRGRNGDVVGVVRQIIVREIKKRGGKRGLNYSN